MPSTLDILATFGNDALANHFNLILPVFPNAIALANLNMRIKTFEIPEQTIETYEITKRGKKLTRPSGISGQSNEFSFTYRIDKYFQTYNSISQWMSFIQNPTNMAMASDSGPLGAGGASEFRVPIIVNGLDANNIITNVWAFTGCWPSSQDAISFDEESGDPLEASVTMQFITVVYPGTTL
jgi:hypothetical protein